MRSYNPFNPSFGGKPQHFFGRSGELELVASALNNPNSPNRALFFTGNRGCGKTALLERVSQLASEAGWLSIDVHSANASEAIVRKLVGGTSKATERALGPSVGVAGTSVSLGHMATTHVRAYDALDLSDVLLEACRGLKQHEGVFITVDEIQKIPEVDMENLCASVQMSMRKGMPVALMMAGLPGAKEQVASYKGCTFMQRVTDVPLGSLLIDETYEAFERLMGLVLYREVADGAIENMASFSQGYPYLMQLVGFHAVQESASLVPAGVGVIDPAVVGYAQRAAYASYRANVLEPTLAGLSQEQRGYLRAMACCMGDDGRAATGGVAACMNKTVQRLSPVRQRLLHRRLIVEDGWGYVRYNLPHLRRYFSEPCSEGSDPAPNVWKHE